MKWLITLFVLFHAAVMPSAVLAQDGAASRTVITQTWEEEWDPMTQSWVRVEGTTSVEQHSVTAAPRTHAAARYAMPIAPRQTASALAQYGPFQVIEAHRAAMIGPTDPMSPRYFAAMLRDFPQIATLDLVEAPGTNDDLANLEVGRMIRAAGIATHVPHNGSVRSGAVELFLAGASRTMEQGARFAVHSWLDHYGREPQDFAPDAPENLLYLDYYREMGMSGSQAEAFYAMTNSVPHHSAKWLDAGEMRNWLRQPPSIAPQGDPVQPLQFFRYAGLELPHLATQPVANPVMPKIESAPIPHLAYTNVTAIGLSPLDS